MTTPSPSTPEPTGQLDLEAIELFISRAISEDDWSFDVVKEGKALLAQFECLRSSLPTAAPSPVPEGQDVERNICLECGDLNATLTTYPTGGDDYDEGCAKCGGQDFASTETEAIADLVKDRKRWRDAYYDAEGKRISAVPAPPLPGGADLREAAILMEIREDLIEVAKEDQGANQALRKLDALLATFGTKGAGHEVV